MRENFLPEYRPSVIGGTLRCGIRDKAIQATPEEQVRQRVLHWLMHDKGWTKDRLRLEKNYRWVGDANRRRGRPDIELLGADGAVLVVVECKRAEVHLSEQVDHQAKDYANKARADWIWTTNGDSHGFLMRKDKGDWTPICSLDPLEVLSDPPVPPVQFPADANDEAELRRYWGSLEDPQFAEGGDDLASRDRRFLLAAHKVLFGQDRQRKLPFSHGGVHLLEDRGSAWHSFGNRSGGIYHTRYADFTAATQGAVEAISIAVNRWHTGGLRLCIGVTKPGRAHHALQLDTAKCVRNKPGKSWSVRHDGLMSQVKSADVLEAVREAGVVSWIVADDDGKEWLHLGELPDTDRATWRNSRELLANLMHYAIIRTNLREAISSR